MNKKVINIKNLKHNINQIKSKNFDIMAMVKANAYGHGMNKIANSIKGDIRLWGVANYKEALSLEKTLGVNHTILVVGKTTNYKALIKNNIHITIDDLSEIYKLIKICQKNNLKCNVHIAVNTGMNRIGIKTISYFKQILKVINKHNCINISGIFTHMFDADYVHSNFNFQMNKFKKFVNILNQKNILIHIGGSFCLNKQIPSFVNMVRVGLFLYGYGNDNLKKVLQIKSKVIKITKCKKGEFIGYGKTKVISNKTIALIPFGYADGLNRSLSGKYFIIINNYKCRVIGKICMDMLMVDITNKNIKVNDDAIVFYDAMVNGKLLKSSPYEILTNFNKARTKLKIIH